MLIDLVPNFFDAISSADPVKGYRRYFDEHRLVLDSYWQNYILDPHGPQADEVIERAVHAQRGDLHALLQRVDVKKIAEESLARCEDLFQVDRSIDLYLMIGVGGANAGELIVAGRGIAFICLEHFTGRPNPETSGMGLSPDLLPVWIAHEIAHLVRYTSPGSRSELARIVHEAGGRYDYWETGSCVTLRELLINEGLAVAASREAAPGFETRQYFGFGSRQYQRLRELEAFMRINVVEELDQTGLGFRMRYLAAGMSPSSRRLGDRVLPERSGYYLGYRMVEGYVAQHGIANALRASAEECVDADLQPVRARSA